MGNQIWITEKIDSLLVDKVKELGPGTKKEGLAHAILLLALTDRNFCDRAIELHKYLGYKGQELLEKMGL